MPRPVDRLRPACWIAAIIGERGIPASPSAKAARRRSQRKSQLRGQREAGDITFGDWQKLCFKPGGAPTLCRTTLTGTFPTGQLAVRVDLIEREGNAAARLHFFVPVGMYLQRPAKLTVDQGNSFRVPYTWCLTNACIAADVAPAGIITRHGCGPDAGSRSRRCQLSGADDNAAAGAVRVRSARAHQP